MYRRGRTTLIVAGCAAVLGAMLLIPGGQPPAIADNAAAALDTPSETIATIDAMLGVGGPELPPQRAAATQWVTARTPAAPAVDPNLETAALTMPEPTPPALDPNLRPDSIGPAAVNLRAGPSSASATVGVLQPGQPVQAGAIDGGWVEVTLADGTTGWVYSRYLASVAAAAPTEVEPPAVESDGNTAKAVIKGTANGDLEGRTARIDATLAARAEPDGASRTLFRTSPGERVKILDVRGNWLRILTADGSSGWIERAG
jgi:SH3-like domain-containing protein